MDMHSSQLGRNMCIILKSMLKEFQKLLSIWIPNARRLKAIAKKTNVDVKIKAMNDKSEIQRLL
jgi:predicted glycosyltransferase